MHISSLRTNNDQKGNWIIDILVDRDTTSFTFLYQTADISLGSITAKVPEICQLSGTKMLMAM